ncbi:6-hydroxymethylpterin diphosphokinase MptE-like protein [Shewanella sp. AC34-MNA-CIBAN-0136]|uniref:6-hydroxymethylpterin diphosphokinase MptE-like protein n=1 Tax=Shewanella sp. AC34-MNA-CIBAN-0136 TaxID=3140463 RepID=UPI00332F83A5
MLNTPSEIGKTFAISQFNEVYLPSVNRHIFEKIDSVSLYEEKFKDALSTLDTLHVIIGLDSGLLANYIMERPLAKGSKYIFVELPEVLALLTIDIPQALQSDLSITSSESFSALIKERENNIYIVKQKFKIHRAIAVSGNYLESYCGLNTQVETTLEYERLEQAVGFEQKIFVQAQLHNLAENLIPARILKQKFVGKSCIILGGGPSLDNSIDWIKANAERLVIIAASRVVGKLNKLNIKVDIVVSVDPQSISFDVNKDFMQLEHDVLLINSYHVAPQIMGQWRGAALYTGTRLPWNTDSDEDNIKTIGPTVINSAIEIATEMGFKQVILCGVDFCHSQTGMTHAQGTYGASLGPNIGVMLEWVETNSGEMAETPMQLKQAIESLQASVALKINTNYINLSKDAAKVKGVQYQECQDVSLEPITEKQRQTLKPETYQVSMQQKLKYLNDTLDNLTTTQDKLLQLNALLSSALALNTKIEKKQKTNQYIPALADKIDKIEQKINKEFISLAHLIKFYGFYEFSHFLSTKKTEEWSQQDVINQTHIYYKTFKAISTEISELVTSSIQRINSRMNEYQHISDINALCKQWNDDKQWGRAVLWQANHPMQYASLNAIELNLIQTAQIMFYEQFVIKKFIDDTGKSIVPRIGNAFNKLQILFHKRHLLGMSKIVEYTFPFITTDSEVSRLYHLALSYLQMLEGKPELALTTILKTPIIFCHEAEFKQIILLSLKLNKLELATEHLAEIIHYSDEYLPQYAHALRLNDKAQEALNIYLDYLNKYPDDIPVLLKLGVFLTEVSQHDAAKTCFKNVLDLDINNQTAIRYLQQIDGWCN